MHVAGEYTSSRLLQEYLRPTLEARRDALMHKLEELLSPFTHCHPITSQPEYARVPRKLYMKGDGRKPNPRTEWSQCAREHEEFPADRTFAAHMLDRAEMYYEALTTLTNWETPVLTIHGSLVTLSRTM